MQNKTDPGRSPYRRWDRGLQGWAGIVRWAMVGWAMLGWVTVGGLGLTGCDRFLNSTAASSAARSPSGERKDPSKPGESEAPPVVEILQATANPLNENTTYIGTTEPRQQVILGAQTTAQLRSLTVDVGDSVNQGQVVGQLDDALLQAAVQEAEAELAGRRAEVDQARARLLELQAAIDEAKAQQQQARVDAERLRSLSAQGAIAQQQAELSQTQLRVAEQQLRSAQEQFRAQEQAIAVAQQRVTAQRAILAQAEKQLSFATLTAPATGVVLARQMQPGDLVQTGQEILTLGDLSEMLVRVEVTDQARAQVSIGQVVRVQLDAIPNQNFRGTVTRISPVSDPETRLIPLEIDLETTGLSASESLGSGLLARVNLGAVETVVVVVPQSAIEVEKAETEIAEAEITKAETPKAQTAGAEAAGTETIGRAALDLGLEKAVTLFAVAEAGEDLVVEARTVQLGTVREGQVEIVAGLAPGERFVVKSDRPLQDGQTVRRSLASEF